MTDVFELLKAKEEEKNHEKKFYVYYEPSTGEIVHFRNYLEEDSHPFIEITESDLDVPLADFESRNYLIVEKDKKMTILKNSDNFEQIFNIDNLVYQIPRVILKNRNEIKKQQYDIVIEQNNKDRVFRIKFSPIMKDTFKLRQNLIHHKLNIYVTAKNDPNILYQTLEFKIHDLLTNQYYTIEFEDFNGEECNLFSKKYFQKYLHADIR